MIRVMRSTSHLTLLFSVLGLAAGCGGDDGAALPADAAVDPGDATVDADLDADVDAPVDAVDPCAGGDGVCRQTCLATDPDCTTTAGDNKCVGNAGELCTGASFPECNTTADVCGNGDCSVTETSDTCYADCGPAPWTWASLEDELVTRINAARAAGITCSGGSLTTRGALTVFAQTQPGAREAAWELAHLQHPVSASTSCNGRMIEQRLTEYGAVLPAALLLYQDGSGTPQAAVDAWIASSLCPRLIDLSYTTISAGIAHDATRGFVLVLD